MAEDTILFFNVRRLLEQQFNRLSPLEQSIMYWLAINREWTTIAQIAEDLIPTVGKLDLLEALESLIWRSLIEKHSGRYTLQCVVLEYVTDRLVEKVTQEIIEASSNLKLFHSHALTKSTVKDDIRQSQFRMILEPIGTKLSQTFPSSPALEWQMQTVLKQLKTQTPLTFSYAAGNLLNLCCYLEIDLSGYG